MKIPKIQFGKKYYCENEGQDTYVYSYGNVSYEEYESYLSHLAVYGFIPIRKYNLGENSFAIYADGSDSVFGAYYPGTGEMRIVSEPNCKYLDFEDTPREEKTTSLLTQIDLEDHGLSYVVRLSDGRFIIFDGGWEFEPDADKLMNCLREQSPHGKPVIAAWIMTHLHLDHYRCYLVFAQKYASEVEIERFIYNFPDPGEENFDRIPALAQQGDNDKLVEFLARVKESRATVYRAHTGQIYSMSNAVMELLSSPDDVFETPLTDVNPTSLVFKMTIENQVILWTADADFEKTDLAERWGTYLKSDILQIPHHGFNGGTIKGYRLADPTVCLVPTEEDICFRYINIYTPENKYLIYNLNVCEYHTGGRGTFSLELPYIPSPNGRQALFDRIAFHQKSIGSTAWYFDTMKKNECTFTVINSTYKKVDFYADLIFADSSKNVNSIKISVPACCTKNINLFDPADADPDAKFFNRQSLKKIGVSEEDEFTVNFKSDVPIIIKGCKPPVYYA